jgi:hypothetical protein
VREETDRSGMGTVIIERVVENAKKKNFANVGFSSISDYFFLSM